MSSCCRRNPAHSYGLADYEGRWTRDQIARSLAAGIISEQRAQELMSTVGSTELERKDPEAYQRKKMMKYGAAAAGIAGLAYLFTKGNK